jgi:hypothetical protein
MRFLAIEKVSIEKTCGIAFRSGAANARCDRRRSQP